MNSRARIVLIHATPVAIGPIAAAFAAGWPEAEPINLLEDSLSPDRAREGDLSPHMRRRIVALGRYAIDIGADGILYTCSAFGPAIDAVADFAPVPVLKPNEAMFAEALSVGRRIGMLATFQPSVASMEEEFSEEAARRSLHATLKTELVPEAMDALRAGDEHAHNALLAARALRLGDCDAVLLAHFSTSRAAQAVRERLSCPVLASPDAAVARLRREVERAGAEARA